MPGLARPGDAVGGGGHVEVVGDEQDRARSRAARTRPRTDIGRAPRASRCRAEAGARERRRGRRRAASATPLPRPGSSPRARSPVPASRSEKPLALGVLSVRCRVGRWKSASAMITCLPTSPKARPRLTTTVDLPSPGSALAIRIRRSGVSRPSSWISTRRRRNASVKRNVVLLAHLSSGWPPPTVNIEPPRLHPRNAGEDGQAGELPHVFLALDRPVEVLDGGGNAEPDEEGEAERRRRGMRIRFWFAAGTGTLGGSITLTTFISPCSRMRAAESFSDSIAVEAAVGLHLGGEARVLELVA